jgi:ABC-2 type transport system ATP-binding protein
MHDLVIETHGLRKRFGTKTAVEDLTLRVGRGEVFGFLGPNGAGKTTAIKMLLGLVTPTSGAGSVLGAPLGTATRRVRSSI